MKVFNETQRFNQWWLIALEIILIIFVIVNFVQEYQEITEKQLGFTEYIPMFFSLGIVLLVIFFIHSIKLVTRIDETGIKYQFFPIHVKERKIAWNDISSCTIRKYNPILEYGGWGIRGLNKEIFLGIGKNGKAYIIKGLIGIQLKLKDGRKILIGTQNSTDAENTIHTYHTNTASSLA